MMCACEGKGNDQDNDQVSKEKTAKSLSRVVNWLALKSGPRYFSKKMDTTDIILKGS